MSQTSKTVDHALQLLQHVAEHGPLSTMELSRELQLNRTVVHRLLKTLEMHAFVTREGSSYRLGLGAFRLGAQVESGLRDVAGPALEKLCDEFRETAVLTVPDDGAGLVIDQRLSSRGDAQIRYQIGFRFSLAFSGHGRAILAFAPQHVVDAVLATVAADDREQLVRSLESVRQQGYAFSRNELRSGTSGLAVPIINGTGGVRGSIGIVTPVGRFPNRRTVAQRTRKIAEEISGQLRVLS